MDKKSKKGEEKKPVLSPFQMVQSPHSIRKIIARLISEIAIDGKGEFSDFEKETADFPRADISSTKTELTITFEVPGLQKKDLNLEVRPLSLFVSGTIVNTQESDGQVFHHYERYVGDFKRTIDLPFKVKTDDVGTLLEDGILTVVLSLENPK